MFDPREIERLARRLSEVLPPQLHQIRRDVEKNFRAILEGFFSEMDLVTQKELEVQKKVVRRTREKLEALEKRVEALEQELERLRGEKTQGA